MPIQKIYNLRRGVKEAKKQIEKLIKEKEWPIIIGVTGGSCSGKGYIAQIIRKAVKGKILSMDDYYIGIKKMKNKKPLSEHDKIVWDIVLNEILRLKPKPNKDCWFEFKLKRNRIFKVYRLK